jgi:serine/threonine-protein kinase
MGEVWLVRTRSLGKFEKFFALKTVLPERATDLKSRAMFLDEARVAFAVSHPNVGVIVDAGDEGGTLYLVMEWVEGAAKSKPGPVNAPFSYPKSSASSIVSGRAAQCSR